MSKRYKGTITYHTKDKRKYTAIVTDTETKEIMQKETITASHIDMAIVAAKSLAKEWEKKHG